VIFLVAINAIWYYVIGFIVIWILALLFKDKLKIDIEGPILMRRTLRLRDFIDSIAQKSPRFWKLFMNIGIPVAVFFMGLTFYLIILASTMIFQSPQIVPILPGVDYAGNPFYIPIAQGLIALLTVIVVHEFAHGILARAEGVNIKSIGVLLLAIIPGAFVEPDEEEVKKVSRLSKLRIYAAGSIFNVTLAGIALAIVFLLSTFFIPAAFHSDGILVSSVIPKSPSDGVLQEGMVIYNINGVNIRNVSDYNAFRNNTKSGDVLSIQTNQGTYQVKLGSNPNNPSASYAGFRGSDNLVVNSNVAQTYGTVLPWILYYLADLLNYIWILNFAIGTINLLPLKPLDGGLIFEELLGYRLSKERVIPIVNSLSYLIAAILIVNIIYAVGRGILLNI
jgi:membrane-associated protease RseP (regulator of RpoE activity)